MTTDYFDVIIVGAGLSGIGAAYYLQEQCPDKSYLILEGRDAIGGTWDLFRYPGIRSDSDMYTLGYDFKPWEKGKMIAAGELIREYVREAAVENDIEQHIRFSHLVKQARWSSEEARWTLTAERKEDGEQVEFACNFLWMCSGYYNYENGYTPEFKGRERFRGEIIHPQKWPEALDYSGRKIIIIGSGATAVTLAPALAEQAGHVTVLQRSPTYMLITGEEVEEITRLREMFPLKCAYAHIRWHKLRGGQDFYQNARAYPEETRQELLSLVRAELDDDYDMETHFTPSYNPWDQRICLVPDADLFKAMRSGEVSVVTDHIDTFTEEGILLQSGEMLGADMIVTATGLNIRFLGGISFVVDGEPVHFPETIMYKGVMYSGVPNMVNTFGYLAASWTLRLDLIVRYVCRLLNHLDAADASQVVACLRAEDREMETRPWNDAFTSGYLQRVAGQLPKQGVKLPWVNAQNYDLDKQLLVEEAIDDGVLQFS